MLFFNPKNDDSDTTNNNHNINKKPRHKLYSSFLKNKTLAYQELLNFGMFSSFIEVSEVEYLEETAQPLHFEEQKMSMNKKGEPICIRNFTCKKK